MEVDADFGKTKRYLYMFGAMFGSLASYYLRNLFYTRYSRIKKGCPEVIFDKPWIGTLMMAIGMSLSIVIYYIQVRCDPKNHTKISKTPRYIVLLCILPGLLDLLYSAFYSFSIVAITGSTSISLRYFDFLFVIIIQNVFLSTINYAYQWVSLGIVAIGIILVSCSVVLGSEIKLQLLPTVLQVLAQLCFSIRTLILQKMLHENDVSNWLLTGISGSYEVIMILFGFYPISYILPEKTFSSLHEDFCLSWKLTTSSLSIIILFIVYIPITCLYNSSVVGTIMTTNGVGYTLVEMISGSIGWVIDLIIYHFFKGRFILKSHTKFGVNWNSYSYLRLIGSLTFLLGGVIYLKIIKFPCFKYPSPSVRRITIDQSTGNAYPAEVKLEV
ncbi:hypothetical protein TVAG_093260 [Trichomonas vaginalis G3]|uniref:Integral membrane protein n=1 Tax=Trichomonas vaginalis (strain ATCC PRA-98 / G3) TaxID=412133 RepID=A2DBE9_TRIV3|nr:solute carrier family 35 member F6 family [Trichomonas vaginalis G3]EAY22152.1 hypothetical protein TVAG_093260 [Trichomonas vaginalis G3]KAI5533400.1 solute carrier family 35 member F6 family [Trichomonas vaginalis G3]|eukprot:XP_001583138.1 hypothetical protein [Trichomonas vaginalis G3]